MIQRLFYKERYISLPYKDKFEANHNKDYSVVKTFRAGKLALLFCFSKI